ncbi:MAG: D-glycero-beta-D-manno-heptose 1-phosphate adenylyltransferase [Gemmatimonadetes bacterium]|nr:D-glycero-beta-D-manno-heptose 1-phosphate adenylyltransferase [Gemmatimonadota bacterium]NIR79926.1 D-glycero-beta-D-manno-heptose 1-phosphate adenylyltransferase [Gemmatimonadota bacterium]NIT88645.1 D-glycero-beta-D-manno-heptose 1-phosphate adenylyltransferase [Gemmatimonadota bacterium]NIU32460.1 D-glycero-beta-D-manno-heptose 1-phosphate adenylyltransferase [Gemmatimonadota bacterium]NIU36953.1 D-glycero-beta-D-manno-heptose 1-phosphate adenylyltransferase [Gemmatimonadota bacterium]
MSGPRRPDEKVLERPEAVERFGRPRRETLVFTNGCFDLLHRGHVDYLDRARRQGDALVVGLNSDASVRKLKGPGRPVVAEEDRARILAALECVDAVVLFAEKTPRSLIAELLPDVLVKGGDYGPEEIVGHAEVRAAGGRVEILPLIEGRSTSLLLERIRRSTEEGGAGATQGEP